MKSYVCSSLTQAIVAGFCSCCQQTVSVHQADDERPTQVEDSTKVATTLQLMLTAASCDQCGALKTTLLARQRLSSLAPSLCWEAL